MNLDEATFDTQITIFAQSQSESDVAQSVIDVQLRKLITETEDETSSSFDVAGIATWIGFIGIILAGVLVLLKILKNTGEEEDDYGGWGDEYQDSLTATYQSVVAAPTVPSGPPTSVPSTPSSCSCCASTTSCAFSPCRTSATSRSSASRIWFAPGLDNGAVECLWPSMA